MNKSSTDYYIVYTSDPHCSEYIDAHYKVRQYLSGFSGSAGTLLISADEAILWTDGRYFIQAEYELRGTGIMLYKEGIEGTMSLGAYLRAHLKKGERVRCELNTMSVTDYLNISKVCDESGAILSDDTDCLYEWNDRPIASSNKIYSLGVEYCGRSYRDKLLNLRDKLNDNKCDGYLFADLSSIMWLFNIRGADIDYNPVAFSYAYVSADETVLFIKDGALDKSLKMEFESLSIRVEDYYSLFDFLSSIGGKTIGLDYSTMNAKAYRILKNNNTVINVAVDSVIDKAVKCDVECRMFRKHHITDAVAMIKFIKWVKENAASGEMDELKAGEYLDRLRLSGPDCLMLSFDTICAYNENAAIVHYSASEDTVKKITNKGLLLVDSGGQYLGATTDITRTIALGELTEEEKLHYTLVLKGVLRLMDVIFLKGTTGANLDIIAREPIWKNYIDYRHGTGHGIGACLNVHEGPHNIRYRIPKGKESTAFVPGMVVSDEPGIYIEGSHGIRIENQLLCVAAGESEWGDFYGFECLTLVPFERDAIIPDMLNEDEKKILNEYHKRVYDVMKDHLSMEEALWLKAACATIS